MRIPDIFLFSFKASSGHKTRTILMLIAMSIGVASVIIFTSLGEGAKNYVTREFSSLGTNLLIILPGRSETTGGPPPLLGQNPRDLTLEDAIALTKSSHIRYVAPITVGSAPVSYGEKEREVIILGSTPNIFEVRQLSTAQGEFLPEGDPSKGAAMCVIGHKLKKELFGNITPLGEWVRIGDRRFRIIGVLAKKGQSLGMDMSDVVIIPVASAQALFNTSALFRVMVQASGNKSIEKAKESIIRIIRERHDNEDDITIITQDALLSTFDRILTTLTLSIAGVAAISLLVAGILIMNVMLIAVSQRRSEIGLLKSIGATNSQVLGLFLVESALLSFTGALLGIIVSFIVIWVFMRMVPAFPVTIPVWGVSAAVGIALSAGIVFGIMPARRASMLNPVDALSRR
ncbi:MAG: ABC transporter permease [Deltaproteobacteria bacterium]|nr:ABC transporter permease [Deltaproteobacteria bacterium]